MSEDNTIKEVKRIPFDKIYQITIENNSYVCSQYNLEKDNDGYTLTIDDVLVSDNFYIGCHQNIIANVEDPKKLCADCQSVGLKHYGLYNFNCRCYDNLTNEYELGFVSSGKSAKIVTKSTIKIIEVNFKNCSNKTEYKEYRTKILVQEYTKNLLEKIEAKKCIEKDSIEQKNKEKEQVIDDLLKELDEDDKPKEPIKPKGWLQWVNDFLNKGNK